MLTSSRSANALNGPLDRNPPKARNAPMLLSFDGRARGADRPGERVLQKAHQRQDRSVFDMANPAVEVYPRDIVQRRTFAWEGIAVELLQAPVCEVIEFRFRAPFHLLAVYEHGVRSDGDTRVEGLPPSTLRDVSRKLTFVPAGHEYVERHKPRDVTRIAYFYIDPGKMPLPDESGVAPAPLAPRLFFEDVTLWNTANKLAKLIEGVGADNRHYFEALGIVLAHELARLNSMAPRIDTPVRGGLAAWQQRTVANYIEDHLAERIPLTVLAQLVRLSPYHFCRAFKQSFGVPPHRYHRNRRIEHAKTLFAKHASSVTDIGMTVGFSETSSFTAAFHKTTGLTPTAFRRSLM